VYSVEESSDWRIQYWACYEAGGFWRAALGPPERKVGAQEVGSEQQRVGVLLVLLPYRQRALEGGAALVRVPRVQAPPVASRSWAC